MKGIHSFTIQKESIDIDYDTKQLKEEELLKAIHNKGYRASFSVFGKKKFSERCDEFFTDREKYALEYKMLSYALLSLLLLLLIQYILCYFFYHEPQPFFTIYSWWIFYLDLSIVTIGAAIWHYHAYKAQITHMVGMMTGMTIGMVSGLLISTIIGATNGMFMGAMVGIVIGVSVGALNGKCCGIMGIMEGMMAGVMGGTMGPMIALMMKYDHILLFMPFFMLINIAILWGLSYMLYEEVVEENPKIEKKPLSFFVFFLGCLIMSFILGFIIIYGYKSQFGIS
jgi:hypothetical protein